jgi:hypothetical protein
MSPEEYHPTFSKYALQTWLREVLDKPLHLNSQAPVQQSGVPGCSVGWQGKDHQAALHIAVPGSPADEPGTAQTGPVFAPTDWRAYQEPVVLFRVQLPLVLAVLDLELVPGVAVARQLPVDRQHHLVLPGNALLAALNVLDELLPVCGARVSGL